MLKAVKTGFGISVGVILGIASLRVACKRILNRVAKDEEFMKREKTRNPELYNELKKYQ